MVKYGKTGFVDTQILRANTRVTYDWSYVVAWIGVGSSLVSAVLLSGAAVCLRGEREREEALNLQYLMPGNQHFITHMITCNTV